MELCSKEKCVGCSACYSICPKEAIKMKSDEEGFLYPEIDTNKCVECGLCKKTCPVLNSKETEKNIYAYAAYNNDLDERLRSSSGGIFSLIAKEIIKKNGVVFGAGFDQNFNVKHIYIEKELELDKLRGSKYVQSKITDSYKKVKQFLESGRYVLFTGTPCQVEGLKHFLGQEYEKLYTQDLICHGSPAPMVWEKYLEYRKKNDKSSPQKISFRYKNNSWKNFKMFFEYENKSYESEFRKDSYIRAFLKNACLRKSCYNCTFKKIHRNSDITLGDFWGIDKILPELDDDKGVSLVLINSEKGKNIFDSIKKNVTYKETIFEESIKYNSAYFQSVNQNKNREKFCIYIMQNKNFEKITKRFVKTDKKWKKKIKKILNKFKKIIAENNTKKVEEAEK